MSWSGCTTAEINSHPLCTRDSRLSQACTEHTSLLLPLLRANIIAPLTRLLDSPAHFDVRNGLELVDSLATAAVPARDEVVLAALDLQADGGGFAGSSAADAAGTADEPALAGAGGPDRRAGAGARDGAAADAIRPGSDVLVAGAVVDALGRDKSAVAARLFSEARRSCREAAETIATAPVLVRLLRCSRVEDAQVPDHFPPPPFPPLCARC
jgi:hypothetical protein